jgi:hypothetical protein
MHLLIVIGRVPFAIDPVQKPLVIVFPVQKKKLVLLLILVTAKYSERDEIQSLLGTFESSLWEKKPPFTTSIEMPARGAILNPKGQHIASIGDAGNYIGSGRRQFNLEC